MRSKLILRRLSGALVLLAFSSPAARCAVAGEPSAPTPGAAETPAVITLKEPSFKGLISVDAQMDPFDLEAQSRQQFSLRNALRTTIDQNLDIGIANTEEGAQRWNYVSALGRFLPDVTTGYSLFGLSGTLQLPFASPNGTTTKTKLPSHFNLLTAGFNYNVYQGGRVVFGALQNLHEWRANTAQSHYTISDALMRTTRAYYNLLLNEALLEVRLRAVDTSTEQLRINSDLASHGLATNLDVLQAETQLSRDRQELIAQQIARRSSAIQLATIMNVNPAGDIIPTDRALRKVRLVNPEVRVQQLLRLALENRPEIKQNEELRLAARNAIVIATAGLQPTVKFGGNVYGLGQNLSNLGTFYTLTLSANWTVHGLGVTDAAATQAARWQARERTLISNREINQIISEVRNSLLQSLRSEQEIIETEKEVASSQEELRLAKLRFENGLGSNIDVITAQRDVTNAQVNRVQALINFNIAQAQLVHDVGLISVDNLSSGKTIGI